ncbi:MAG: hypothetical protein KY469_06750 [Actinobacteria bacterium]|nr:hypothetical protein [Actinomycetota bacterium]
MHRGPRRLAVTVVAAFAVLGVACDTAPTDPEAGGDLGVEFGEQPAELASEFEQLPVAPGSQAVGPDMETEAAEGAVTRSYEVAGRTPQQVLEFYERELDSRGWVPRVAPTQAGARAWQGEWTHPEIGAWLIVSASPFEPGSEDEIVSQYSLVLRQQRE